MIDWKSAKDIFEKERDTPYRIPLSLQDVDDCCAGKHIRLRKNLEALGISVRWRICWFKWSDTSIPENIRSIPHEDECSHLYIEVELNNNWVAIDASWDLGLASILPVSVWSEPFTGTSVGVPAYKTLSPEESEIFMNAFTSEETEEDLRKNGAFFKALNVYLEEIRTVKYATNFLNKVVDVVIDRPLGSTHPKHGWPYPLNYGFLPNTKAPDGEGLDAYILGVGAPLQTFRGKCIAVLHRTNDNDDKLIVIPEESTDWPDDEKVKKETYFQEQFFKIEIIRKPMNCFAFYQSIEASEADAEAFTQQPDFTVPYHHPSFKMETAFYFSKDKRFLGIRVKLSNVYLPTLHSTQFIAIQQASEYAMALLRLKYSVLALFKAPYLPSITTEEEDCPAKLFLPYVLPREPNFDPKELGDFAKSLQSIQSKVDDDLWLLSNAYNKRLPAIYRYLSLTKIFEKYKSEKKGVTFSLSMIAPYFEKYDAQYQVFRDELGLPHPKGENYAFDLRGKVSHRVSGGKSYTPSSIHGHFSYEIEQFTERIAQRVAIDIINEALSKLPDPHPVIVWMNQPGLIPNVAPN